MTRPQPAPTPRATPFTCVLCGEAILAGEWLTVAGDPNAHATPENMAHRRCVESTTPTEGESPDA